MRILPTDEHQLRKERILQAVVHLYIKTGKPVGSSTIVSNFKLNLSPATIRNVLAELESAGYLTHPHTSAGRIPTDQGYRFYVDAIANIQRLAMEEEERIQTEYFRKMREIEDLMISTTRVLSQLSHCTGFALRPTFGQESLKRVELIPVSNSQILGVLVSDAGFVRNQMIPVDLMPTEEDLRRASKYLTQKLAGQTFSQAKKKLPVELENYYSSQISLRDFYGQLAKDLFAIDGEKDLLVEGASNLLNFPEFQDFESMRKFAHIVDERKALSSILNREISQQGLNVRIGKEASPELKDLSVVSASYEVQGRPVGMLGILGPKRMDYEKMMSIVNSVAGLVNKFLENQKTRLLEDESSS